MLPRIDDTAQPGSCPMGGPRYSPPARAGGFYCHTTTAPAILGRQHKPMNILARPDILTPLPGELPTIDIHCD